MWCGSGGVGESVQGRFGGDKLFQLLIAFELSYWQRLKFYLNTNWLELSAHSKTRSMVAVEPRRPPMTDVGTETAFRLDQRKHFRKSKHLLSSEVN